MADLSRATLNLDGTASDLKIGQEQADALLSGDLALVIDVAMADQVFTLRQSTIDGPAASLLADGILSSTSGALEVSGRLTDISTVLAGALLRTWAGWILAIFAGSCMYVL